MTNFFLNFPKHLTTKIDIEMYFPAKNHKIITETIKLIFWVFDFCSS